MENKLKIPFPVIVEGRYDKQTLGRVIDAPIITTEGFGIFKDSEKRALITALARKSPVIILTDPDGAGRVIRSAVKGFLPPERTIMLHVPKIRGKENRKPRPAAEGLLGVEGQSEELLYRLFLPFSSDKAGASGNITPAMLMKYGMCGGKNAQKLRDEFGKQFGLPDGMNSKAFRTALGFLADEEGFLRAAEQYFNNVEK